MQIRKSTEDYLEAMLILEQEKGYIRSVDIANQLGVTKPSVSYATKRLRENGYITMDPDGRINLADPGREVAETIYERHQLLTQLFTNYGVNPKIAREDACKIEHDISPETFAALKKHATENNEL